MEEHAQKGDRHTNQQIAANVIEKELRKGHLRSSVNGWSQAFSGGFIFM